MDNDLERSVRLLEDALSSSGRGLFRKSLRRSRLGEEKPGNNSVLAQPYELQNLLMSEGMSMYDQTLMNVSNLLQGDQSLIGNVLQASVPPWKMAIDGLYTEFFEVMQNFSGGQESILEVVTDLARCCSDALKVIQSLKSKVAISQLDEEVSLEKERNTWRLLYILYQDRSATQNLMDDDGLAQYFGRSEKLCVENLFKRDGLIRESQLVIDWLESCSADRDDEILHFSDSTLGWENTLHQLQSADTIAFSSTRQIVSEMDPDAPHHQKRPLHDLDMEDDKRLSRKVFHEIRCGKLEEAQKLCRQSGHGWKAALFEGWRLFHDPNIKENEIDTNSEVDDGYEEMDSNDIKEIKGNDNRDVWKNMALKYCKQECLSQYDKASVGTFCGCLTAMLPVCYSWEDSLWAYMKTMVDIRVESEIRDCVIRQNDYITLPEEYWLQRMSINEVFSSLESSKSSVIREESRRPDHVIQKYIVLDEIPTLVLKFEEWIEDKSLSTSFLRFLSHLVWFFDQTGQSHNKEITDKVLEVYIKRLMEMKETHLVALYVSKVSPSNQNHLYAKYLEKIIDNEERKTSLMWAEDCSLDVLAITKQVVENIRNIPHEMENDVNLQHKMTDLDSFKISALDWLTFYDEQRAEIIGQVNALIFTFLTLGKVDAAHLAFNKIPSDAVKKILSEGSVRGKLNQIIKEHFSYKAYLDASEAFNEWFKHFKSRPMPPEKLPATAQFPEKVAHQHRESQYTAELERWKLSSTHLVKEAKMMLYNVLLFPEGWLVGAQDDEYLRSICIPEIVLLLYSLLYETECYEECVQLADIIASEKHCLYKVYSKEKLGEILVKLCETSVALLNAKKDPWGNETSA